jgi:peptidyl-prolyl cis-trans isomerase D
MATLEKIRNKAGILVAIFIGFALIAFVLTDLLNSGSSLFQKAGQDVAEINGNSVTIQEFYALLNQHEEFAKLQSGRASLEEREIYQIHDQAWRELIIQTIMKEKYDELGLNITSAELLNMVTGSNVHPRIRQIFTNPQTGIFDKAQLIGFLQRKKNDPNANFFWNYNEKQIITERTNAKYTNLLKKGMYVTSQQAELEAKAKGREVNFDFIVQRYNTISDSAVTVSDAEIKDYYNKHIDNYKQEATRDIEYVTFEVLPSEEDRIMTEEWVANNKETFADPATDAVQYVKMNSDGDYDERNLKISQLSLQLQGFVEGANEGDVYGPYLENEAYKLTRVVSIKQLPDSVKARHILIRATADPAATLAKADSLMKLINNGADFATLARENSEDPGSAINGGDLGWFAEGMMVKPFNDACFNGKRGDVVKVETQFGVHIINIQQLGNTVAKYNLATLERNIAHSSKTYQEIYSQATKFAALNNSPEKFNEAIETDNLTKRYGRGIRANDRNVGALQSPRQLVRWAFENEVGSMSPIYEFGNEFVIAVLTDEKEAGKTPLAMVSNQIKRDLLKEKKADKIIAEITSKQQANGSLSSLAENLNTTVQTAEGITFADQQVTGAGIEPALVALALSADMNTVSVPIAGNNGVFVVRVTSESDVNVDVEEEKRALVQANNFKVDYRTFEAIQNKAEVEDNRINFF